MLFALSTFMLIILAFFVHRFRVPMKHRWRRRQARTMEAQLRGRDRLQPPQLLYTRLRAMDPLAFEELLLESFERRCYKVIRNRRYTGDGAIWFIQAKRYADTVRPEHVAAFEALCRARRKRGLFIHTGRSGPQSRAVVAQGSSIEILSGRALLSLLTDGPFPDLTNTRPHARSVSVGMTGQ